MCRCGPTAPSIFTPTSPRSAPTAPRCRSGCCTKRAWPWCRAWISARRTAATRCGSRTPRGWSASRRRSSAWGKCSRKRRPAPRRLLARQRDAGGQRQAAAFGLHLGAVAAVAGAGGAHVAGQAAVDRAAPFDAVFQDGGADADVRDRVERVVHAVAQPVELVL